MPTGDLHFDFHSPRRIVFGWGRRSELGELGRSLGRRALLFVGSRTLMAGGAIDALSTELQRSNVTVVRVAEISREPEVADVDRAAEVMRAAGVGDGDFCLAVGGGSAIDLAKGAAAMSVAQGRTSVLDYLEGVGRGLSISERPLPILAMPTTAGTGSEATKNAVISSYDPPFKKSLRSPDLLPQIVLVDPQLAQRVPPPITAATGMDAITQLIESYLSRRATPTTRALSLAGLEDVLPALRAAVADGSCRWARERMAQAALLSGMALANSGLGFAHGVAAALGVHCRISHGLACAVMLPAAMRVNRDACQADLARIGEQLTGSAAATEAAAAEAAIEAIESLCNELGIPRRLSQLGVSPEQIPDLVRDCRGNSMSGNPRDLNDEEVTDVLEAML